MKNLLKRELKIWAQYFVIALVAWWIHFSYFFTSKPGINIHEAWRIYEPLLSDWLFIFAILSVVRLLLVMLVHKLFHPSR